jgi:hypothetical protein
MLTEDLVKAVEKVGGPFPLRRADLIAWMRRSTIDLFEQFAHKAGKTRWAEKTPAHVYHMTLIHEVFPGAQFIHMVRNGYDVVKSLQNMPWAPRRIRWSTNTWVSSVRAGREAGAKLPTGLYKEIRYEMLIKNPRQILEEVCAFIGEPFSPQMLEFHDPEKNSWQKQFTPLQSKPINNYRALTFRQRLAFTWSAGRLMRELGYE